MKINEISVVICNKNSVNYLKKSIPLYKNINFKEIFVIDGNSTDGSLNYLRENNIKFYSDDGNGLSYSRFLEYLNQEVNIFSWLVQMTFVIKISLRSFVRNLKNLIMMQQQLYLELNPKQHIGINL